MCGCVWGGVVGVDGVCEHGAYGCFWGDGEGVCGRGVFEVVMVVDGVCGRGVCG